MIFLRCTIFQLAKPFSDSRELGRVSNLNKSINGHYHKKDHVEISHLTKYDAFRVNRDKVMDLEISVQNPYKRL